MLYKFNLYENYNTSNQTEPFALGHENYVTDIKMPDCSHVTHLSYIDRCPYVKNTTSCINFAFFYDYSYLYYCAIEPKSKFEETISVIVFLILITYLFAVLATTADVFFCPALTVQSKILGLSENLAGNTLLAFGNGSPDLFTSFATINGENPMLFAQVYGATMFVSSVVACSIMAIAPFKLVGSIFFRDCGFLLLAVSAIDLAIVSYGEVTLLESFAIVSIYVIYLIILIIDQILLSKEEKVIRRKIQRSHMPNEADLKDLYKILSQGRVVIKTKNGSETSTASESRFMPNDHLLQRGGNDHLLQQFFDSINPIDPDDWDHSNIISKVLMVLKSPVTLLLLLIIPVVDYNMDLNGWSKLLNCVQIQILPTAFSFFLLDFNFYGIHIGAYVLSVLLPASALLFWLTRTDRVPKYHSLFTLYTTIASICVIWIIANEVVNALSVIGIITVMSPSFLAATVLAWGNSIGDLIANKGMARRGYQAMGLAASFGGPLFNSVLGLGIVYGVKAARSPTRSITISQGSLGENCLVFLLIHLTLLMMGVCLTNFNGRRSIGIFGIIVYFLFLFFSLLGELEFIHPYGTDHTEQRGGDTI